MIGAALLYLSMMVTLSRALGAVPPPGAGQGRRELEAADNEVWQPPAPTDRLSLSFSTLIKALYRLKTQTLPEPDPPASQESDDSDVQVTTPWQPSAAPHLVEDIPDVLPLPFETDKSNKFTHSFRFGYGVPV